MTLPADSPPKSPVPAPRTKRRFLRRFLMMLGVVAVLAVIAAFAFQGAIGRLVGSQVAAKLAAQLGTEVSIQETSFSWFGGLDLRGLSIKDPKAFGDGEAFAMARLHVDFDLSTFFGLLGGSLHFGTRVESPRLVVRQDAEGRSNWQTMLAARKPEARTDADGEVEARTGHGGEDDDEGGIAHLQRTLRNFDIVFELEGGSVTLIDAASGTQHGIEELRSKLAIRSEAGGALFHLDGVLTGTGQDEPSPLHLTATLPFVGDPSMHLDLPKGIELESYRPLVEAFLEPPFTGFAGRVQGDLRLASSARDGSLVLGGKLSVHGLHLLGGPFGADRGIVAEDWTIEPAVGLALAEGGLDSLPDLAGTRIDLGFLKLESQSSEEALAAFADRSQLRRGTGLGGSLDLAAMGRQFRLPGLAGLEGRVTLALAIAEPAPGAARPIALRADGTGLRAAKGATPLPPEFHLEALAVRRDGGLAAPEDATIRLRAPGLSLDATTTAGEAGARKGTLTASLASAADWLSAVLPAGMQILQPLETELSFEVDAEAVAPRVDGRLAALGLAYQDNRLEDARFELHYGGGKLELTPVGVARLNRGPLELRLAVDGVDGTAPTMTSKLAWSEGVATWGLTPYIRYAFPFLAGLPIDDAQKLAQLDFRSFAAFDLELAGPLPMGMDQLKGLSGKGSLQLSDGAFTPSQALAQVLALLGGKDKVTFKDFRNSFALENGRVAIKDCKLGGGSGQVTVRGSTGLDGSLDVRFDLRGLLASHKDGQAILQALGDGPIEVALGGSLSDPSVQGGDVLESAVKGGLEQGLRKVLEGLGEGKKPEDSLKDWFDKLKKK